MGWGGEGPARRQACSSPKGPGWLRSPPLHPRHLSGEPAHFRITQLSMTFRKTERMKLPGGGPEGGTELGERRSPSSPGGWGHA